MPERQLRDLGAYERLRRQVEARDDECSAAPANEAIVRRLMEPLSRERADAILDRALASRAQQSPRMPARTGRRALATATLLFAAAAALLLLFAGVWSSRPEPSAAGRAVVAALDYEMTIAGSVGVKRGGDLEVSTFVRGDRIELRLRPRDEAIRRQVRVSVRATRGDRVVVLPWQGRPRGADGVLEVVGPADDLLRESAGEWVLSVDVEDTAGASWHGKSKILLITESTDER